ncbi:Amidase, hydantoinase/carbamoylase [Nitrosococcus oceani ATCC 19707]|uniref:Amidase, hydantoinase/carbamoylase n=2 Tax=Nitrosococcus oceani TaxID=1229 RepID=Q3JD02_NITOC|nr:Zn-dependent hydrolase [Nitrosococcus oceani]ABA57294.1 Amidase, hydantoinase/carbamoylase [Nitrosococcus oceani ATCC 19707]EDZ67358.1 amidase, hydantoinase/carbamoylase family [Nitrosococcus oceani AFC27]KFI20270.1 allantoate amidohydrolase [Nitrosococcus oceani C-27]GEM20168.1 Zn-dependent hydrolase [Nitrosococcus oceani]
MKTPLRVNFKRLQADVETLAHIGRRADYGLYRMAFSKGDQAAREWFQERIHEAGLDLYIDGAANIHARFNWNGERPSVMTGSHLDTVPGAGHLDGALGVLVGLECLRRFKELDLSLRYAVEAIAFTDEEGRFGGLLGSQAISGRLTPEAIHNARDLDGISLSQAMTAQGLNPADILRARRKPESLIAFLELHIEQGPILERQGVSVGVVEGIVGLFKWEVTLKGTANHAGTTPMDMRQDALQGLAEFAGEITRVLEENGGPRSVATIGRVEVFPGAANVIPGSVKFSLDVRDTEAIILKDLTHAFRLALSAIARRRGLMFEFEVLSEIEPVKCDPGIMETIFNAARSLGVEPLQMPSGAAHDTQIMATLTRAGMIFVPSQGGRSHSPAEWTPWEDIETGANVALNTLYQLAH